MGEGGLKLRWGDFVLRSEIYRKRRDIELRSQLIINKKSYIGFRFVQKHTQLSVTAKNNIAIGTQHSADFNSTGLLFRYSNRLAFLFNSTLVICVSSTETIGIMFQLALLTLSGVHCNAWCKFASLSGFSHEWLTGRQTTAVAHWIINP